MTPQEKAEELVNKFLQYADTFHNGNLYNAKQCAFIAVDEILKCEPTEPSDTDWDDCGATAQYYWPQKKVDAGKFWGEVKQEIQNL